MKLLSLFAVVAAAVAVQALDHHGSKHVTHRHAVRADAAKRLVRRQGTGRCRPRPSTLVSSSTVHTSTTKTASTTSVVTTSKATTTSKSSSKAVATSTSTTAQAPKPTTSSSSAPAPKPTVNKAPVSVHSNSPLITVQDNACGPNGATQDVTSVSGPNGNIHWLTCGIDGKGWTPPTITVSDVKTVALSDAVKNPNSPFHACSAFIDLFNQYGDENNLPPILLASIAMQESSCDPSTVGGAGEQGLMQITVDKCGGAPGGNCKDPNFNIKTGAKFFADTLAGNGGNLLLTFGNYNGWEPGLTVGEATAAAHTSCCRCQQNLDYLHQTFNGWFQNVNAYQENLGFYHNLDTCGSD